MGKKETIKIKSVIPGVDLLVKEEFEQIKIPLQTIKNFFSLVKMYRKVEEKENFLKEEKATLKELLVKIVSRFPGLEFLGLQTKIDNLRTAVFKSVTKTITYNRELLKRSLGEAYPGVVAEDLQLTILLTPDTPKDEVIKTLKNLFGEEAYKKVASEEIILRVDDDKLMQMVAQKQVALEGGARVVDEKISWHIKTTAVKE